MRLAHLSTRLETQVAVVDDEFLIPVGDDLPHGIRTIDDLIRLGGDGVPIVETALEASTSTPVAIDEADLRSPILRPSKVLCIGMNYRDHAEEQGVELPERPLMFAKLPSALAGPGDEISWSTRLTNQVDWEAELAVVVGKPLREASSDEALDAVFGYTAANDLSARDLQFSDGQWVRSKSLDGFLPLGPTVALAGAYDPTSKTIGSRVNGEQMQDSSTEQLIFGVGEILAFLSASFTLLPGDLVLTGTPAGVGAFRDPPRFLRDGDQVEIHIGGIGVLHNTMRERR